MIAEIRRRLSDPPTEITISLFTGYAAFLPADELGLSGVLAAVTAGLYLGWLAPQLISPETRLMAYSVWEVLIFLLNAALFILIGLQLPVIMDGLDGRTTAGGRLRGARLGRGDRGSRHLDPSHDHDSQDGRPAALATRPARALAAPRSGTGPDARRGLARGGARTPFQTDGAPLPDRDLILFITFAVILVTVVGQGLTLPWLIRRLG